MKPRTLVGVVVRGDGRGRDLGYPTANLKIETGDLPENGVYAVEAEAEGLPRAKAACNVGSRPTVAGTPGVHVEVHIPGFSGELYGRRMSVRFVRRIRAERKFASLDELKAQIARDVASLRPLDKPPAASYNDAMSKLNSDGNLFGRLTALAVLVGMVVWVGRVCGVSVCPMGSGLACPFSSASSAHH
jgi:hypothetical protein